MLSNVRLIKSQILNILNLIPKTYYNLPQTKLILEQKKDRSTVSLIFQQKYLSTTNCVSHIRAPAQIGERRKVKNY